MTGAGAPGTRGTIFSLQQGALREKLELFLFGADLEPENIPNGLFEKRFALPSPESEGYLDQLKFVVESNSIDVVLPQTTRELALLSAAKAALKTPCVVADEQAIAFANNKARVTEIFSQLGLGAPNFRVAVSMAELERAMHDMGFPDSDVVVKITDSSGGRGVRIVTNRRPAFSEFSSEKPNGLRIGKGDLFEALSSADVFPELLVTEPLQGPEVSVDAYIGNSGAIAIPRTRDVIRTGISTRTSLFRDESLSERTLEGARAIGLSGVFGFQFMLGPNGFSVIECNPRVQGTMVASLMTGNNLIWMAVRDSLELTGEFTIVDNWLPATFMRSWGGSLNILGKDYLI